MDAMMGDVTMTAVGAAAFALLALYVLACGRA